MSAPGLQEATGFRFRGGEGPLLLAAPIRGKFRPKITTQVYYSTLYRYEYTAAVRVRIIYTWVYCLLYWYKYQECLIFARTIYLIV